MKALYKIYETAALRRRVFLLAANLLIGAGFTLVILGFEHRALSPIIFFLLSGVFLFAFGTTKLGYRRKKPLPNPKNTELYCPEATPIQELRGNDKLLFCIHGFPATPADFRRDGDGDRAASQGWDIVAPLLPGCGTRPLDIVGTDWNMYLDHVRAVWKEFRPRYKNACIIGLSIGGALALSLAEEFAGDPLLEPTALATVGAPVMLNSWFRHGVIRSPAIYFARLLGLFAPAIGAGFPDPDRVGEDGDGRWKGYVGLFPRQVYSLQVGLEKVRRNLNRVACPLLVSHVRFDRVIPHSNAFVIAESVSSSIFELNIVNMDSFSHARHNLFLYDSQRAAAWTRILDFFARVGP